MYKRFGHNHAETRKRKNPADKATEWMMDEGLVDSWWFLDVFPNVSSCCIALRLQMTAVTHGGPLATCTSFIQSAQK